MTAVATNGIPFLDLVTPHEELKEQLHQVFQSALATAGFVGGPMVEEFERDFAKFCDVKHCVGVANGTDAVRFALMAAGVKEGDIAVTVPNTFIATTEAISQAGARPAFVDIDERTYNMDPQKLQEYLEVDCYFDADAHKTINRKSGRPVTAVVPVHLYGQTAEMDPVLELARRFNLTVVEDACQAHGAEYFSERQGRWVRAGSIGQAAAFSFYPGKNLGACGEAGAVTTNDGELAKKIRMLRDHGQAQKYYHEVEGYNGRLDAIQAGILQVKLKYLQGWNESRWESAQRYQELLGSTDTALRLPHEPAWAKPVYHLYVVRLSDRDRLQKHLAEARIGTGIHYPVALHLQNAYCNLGYKPGDFPVAETAAREVLSLPMFPGIGRARQSEIAQHVLEFLSKSPVHESTSRTLLASA